MSRNSRHILFSAILLQPKKVNAMSPKHGRESVSRWKAKGNYNSKWFQIEYARKICVWKIAAAATFLRRDKLKTNKHKRNWQAADTFGMRQSRCRYCALRTFYNYVLHSYYFCIHLSRVPFWFFVPKRKSAFAMCERDFSLCECCIGRAHYSELTGDGRNLTIYEH